MAAERTVTDAPDPLATRVAAVRLTIGTAACLATLLLPAMAASAHAQLVSTTPTDGETVAASPEQIELDFSETVSVPMDGIRLFDHSATRVSTGLAERSGDGSTVVLPVTGQLGMGTYVVTWRVVSADGHPINGAFVFHVGAPSQGSDEDIVDAVNGEGGGGGWAAVAAGLARWLTYAAALAVIGSFCFIQLFGDAAAGSSIVRLITICCVVGAVGSLLQVALFAIRSTGQGIGALADADAWIYSFASPVGVAALVRVAGLIFIYVGVVTATPWTGWGASALLVAAELVSGHTRTTTPAWLAYASDAAHVATAAVWFGGLAALLLSLRSWRAADRPAKAAQTVAGFSTMASWSVLGLVVAGAFLAWLQVRALSALFTTPYGWTLLAKLVMVGVVLLVALYNKRRLVPAIVKRSSDSAAAWTRLQRTVLAEATGLVVVLGVTALLVDLQPAAEAAGIEGPFSTYVEFGDGQLNLVVDPNRAGLNEIHVYLLDASGVPADSPGEVTIELSLPAQDIGPIVRNPTPAGPGHYLLIGNELALPGEWDITVRQRTSEFEEVVVTVTCRVN
ncbi:MAG TPA: copper resistance protein CopC [Acidimicrobiia bacterium]